MKALLLSTLLLATAGGAYAQQAAFGTVNSYSTGSYSYPYAIAAADVDRDGRLDLLTANNSTGTVGVLLGSNIGVFGALTTYSLGSDSYPRHLVVADVNGDGKPDALTANYGTNTVGVLLGTGTGGFSPVTTYRTGSNSLYGIAVADVNGDGKPDVLTANYFGDTVGVLLGTGTGAFGTVTTFSTGTGSNPSAVAVADVNSDGKPDLLTANIKTNTVGLLLGTGTGTFGAATTFSSGGTRPFAIVAADVNRDGKPDVLVANSSTFTVGVLLGTGTGSFGAATTFNATSGSGYVGVDDIVVADINGDDKLDLLAVDIQQSKVNILLGTGTGSFGVATPFSTGTSTNPYGIAVVDVNGDRRPDLLTANFSTSTAGVLLNTGTYTPLAATASLAAASVALYPNPAPHAATLTGAEARAQVQVYNVLGSLVLATQADATGTAKLPLPANLPAGLYLVRSGTGPALRLTVE